MKIKNSVSTQDLEKLGFIESKDYYNYYNEQNQTSILIRKDDRGINRVGMYYRDDILLNMFNLGYIEGEE